MYVKCICQMTSKKLSRITLKLKIVWGFELFLLFFSLKLLSSLITSNNNNTKQNSFAHIHGLFMILFCKKNVCLCLFYFSPNTNYFSHWLCREVCKYRKCEWFINWCSCLLRWGIAASWSEGRRLFGMI
jgi:hypothetical protein